MPKTMRRTNRPTAASFAALWLLVMGGAAEAQVPGPQFVEAFAATCLPERLDYQKTLELAGANGWQRAADDADPELAVLMSKARAALVDPENPDWHGVIDVFTRDVEGGRLFLVSDRYVAPGILTQLGCYLYDFAATEMIDPALLTAIYEHPLAYSTDKPGDYFAPAEQLVSHVWGPPKKFPRMFDTYLTLVPEGSPVAVQTGFTGLVLKTSNSEPKYPGQVAEDAKERAERDAATVALPGKLLTACVEAGLGGAGSQSTLEAAGWTGWSVDADADPLLRSQYLEAVDPYFGDLTLWVRTRQYGARMASDCTVSFSDFGTAFDLSALGPLDTASRGHVDDLDLWHWHAQTSETEQFISWEQTGDRVTLQVMRFWPADATGPGAQRSPITSDINPNMEVSS